MTTWMIETEADTRSKSRKIRRWTIEADTVEDALYQARVNHFRVVGCNLSIWAEVISQNGAVT